jgi:RNA recognition motif-containing protein
MREFFSQFGKVIDSTVMLDRETGRSKGFGFVSFEDTNVQPFLGFGNLEIDGKVVSAPFPTESRSVRLISSLRLMSNWLNRAIKETISLMSVTAPISTEDQVDSAANKVVTAARGRKPPDQQAAARHSTHKRSPRSTHVCSK